MNPVGRWKVYDSEENIIGVFEGHIIDVVHDVSALPNYPLTLMQSKEEPFSNILLPLATNTARFYMADVKKEVLSSPPDYRNSWFQELFLKEEPKNGNWLVVQTAPYVKVEFI